MRNSTLTNTEINMPELTPTLAMLQQLEESWRLKVDEASSRYRDATAHYSTMLEEQGDGATRGPDSPHALVSARQAKSQALAELRHALRIFTDLAIHHKVPQGQPAAGSNGQESAREV